MFGIIIDVVIEVIVVHLIFFIVVPLAHTVSSQTCITDISCQLVILGIVKPVVCFVSSVTKFITEGTSVVKFTPLTIGAITCIVIKAHSSSCWV